MTDQQPERVCAASGLDSSSRRIFVVLGMHRSGTSVAARALQALGVDLGSDLLGPSAAENPRGFFEDQPLLDLSARVLDVLGMSWDSTALVSADAWQSSQLLDLEAEAARSIDSRFADVRYWGFKNPRTARLLPFWMRVFERIDVEPSYLMVLRNPLSIARSLAHRNDTPARRSHLLWLLHMTEAVRYTGRTRRACVDYDQLIADPLDALRRIAHLLGLVEPTESSSAYREFADEFLDAAYQTTRFRESDVAAGSDISRLAVSAYETLLAYSNGDPAVDDARLQQRFNRIHSQLTSLAPVFNDLAETDAARQSLAAAFDLERTRATEFAELAQVRAQQVDQATRHLTERTAELVATQQQISTLTDQDAERRAEALENMHAFERVAAHNEELSAQIADADTQLNEREARLSEARVALAEAAEAVRVEAGRRDSAERRSATLSREFANVEAETAATRKLLSEARRAKDARDRELEHLHQTISNERHQRVTLIRDQAAALSGEFLVYVEALSQTRHWRLAGSLQRGVSRLRRKPWDDGMRQVHSLAQRLHAESRVSDPDLRFLAALASEIRKTLAALSSSESFRLGRAITGLSHSLRIRRRPPGALEFVHERINQMEFYFSQSSQIPGGVRATQSTSADDVADSAVVDIVIPVFGARASTLRCIESVLDSHNRTTHELIVIDDGSQDASLSRALSAWEKEGCLTLLCNERNLGFPATANRGMALHPERDVILLNSDTLVHGNWLDRLRASAYSDWKIATATPFSNNGEICSYPTLCQAADMPTLEEIGALDGIAAEANASLALTLPTAVGYCMYVRREALREVGYFDAERFGRGYGEENDFCLRARALGYRHVLAANVFVGHEGGVSFSDSKAKLIEEGLQELDRTYPEYRAEVQSFVRGDPARWLRQRIDVKRFQIEAGDSIVMVTHDLGGGTHRHVLELATLLEAQGTPALVIEPIAPDCVRLSRPAAPAMKNLEFRMPKDFERLVECLLLARVSHVHWHHLIGVDPTIRQLPAALACEYDVTLHDYLAICPRIHLVDESGRYCGLPNVRGCTDCVSRNGSEAGFDVDISRWRREHAVWLSAARRIFVPSEDARTRMEPLLPGIRIDVRPHPEQYERTPGLAGSPRTGRNLRIAVIGAIGPHKGAGLLLDCARDAADRNLSLEFHLIGYSDRDAELLSTGRVKITGRYEEEQLERLVRKANCQFAFIPSLWPETYCYTLSEAMRLGMQPIVFDLGAQADRVRSLGWGEILPLEAAPSKVNDRLLEIEARPFPEDLSIPDFFASYSDLADDYYGLGYGSGAATRSAPLRAGGDAPGGVAAAAGEPGQSGSTSS